MIPSPDDVADYRWFVAFFANYPTASRLFGGCPRDFLTLPFNSIRHLDLMSIRPMNSSRIGKIAD